MDSIEKAAWALRNADAILIGAGAGMGVDSGLPDFRGKEGFWRAYPAIAKLGKSFAEMANPEWFRTDPRLAWAFYGHRLNLYRRTSPHAGFAQLLKLGAGKPHGYFVYTSNVDGHFQRAGFASDRVFECHGSIHHFQCAIPCGHQIWDATDESVSVDETAFRAEEPLPKCRACGGLARPNILMFGDGQWNINRAQSQQVHFGRWLTALTTARARLVVVELGAGTAVPSVRHASEEMIDRLGAKLIRINPREPEVPPGQIGIAQGAAETIDRICRALAEMAD